LVLSTQLEILHAFLPMDCWLVAIHEDGRSRVISVVGEQRTIADPLVICLGGQWPGQDLASGFICRAISPAELDALMATGHTGRSPKWAFKASLNSLDGELSGIVMGCSSEAPWHSAIATRPAREIQLCLRAIALTLNLHTELTVAEKLVYETQQNAQTDPLTQVLNRTGWNKRVRSVSTTETDVAVGLLDLDFLKFINDTQGHLAGDELLKSTARAVKSVLRANDSVARIGGDEFAVLLFDVAPSGVAGLKERLQRVLSESDISASIGVALRSETGSLATALQLADARMYEEKRSKQRNRVTNVSVFDFE